MRREYQKTLDVDIDYITIASLRKDDVGDTVTIHSDDISRWGYVSLKEDLFKNFMSCEIMIVDQDGFFLNRFRTEEVIVIKFKTPPLKGSPDFDTRLHYFYLYKIDPVTIMDKPYGAVYVVHGISFEYFYNSLRTFSKALKGKTEKIASDIYYEFLEAKSQRTIKKTLKVGRPTKHEMKFTFPYVNPVDAINHLASVSIDSKNPDICNYVFFENKDGFNFISITELIETPRKTHNYITNKIMEDPYYEFDKYFYNTMNILPTNTGDKIIDTLDGIHGEYFAEFDLLYKSYKPYTTRVDGKTTYGKRYLDYFPKTKHLNPKPLLSKENELFKHPLGRNRVCFTNASLYSEERNLGGDRKEWRLFDTHEGEYSFQRRSMMQQINGFNIEVTVPGNSSITVGDIFVLDTIIYRTEDKEKYLSGKYLITAVNHHIALGTGYKCVLTLSRDSILSDDFDDNTKAETGD